MNPLSKLPIRSLTVASVIALVCSPGLGQQRAFDSPGSSSYFITGQTNQFTNDFNPALGVVVDMFADHVDSETDDGFDFRLRLVELNASGFVDPNVWAYLALVSEEGEAPEVEEMAVNYIGFEGNSTLKAGRFFVDFGKQMQTHIEELRTLERALPLREYLGSELAGDGVQYDYWFAAGDSPVRFSVGAFSSLLQEGHHEEEELEPEPELFVSERKKIDEFSLTGRLTGMTDIGDSGLLQLGFSGRFVPEFSAEFADADLSQSGLSNTVYGADLTYGWTGETGLRRFWIGGEYLINDGDLAVELDDPGTPTALEVVNDTAHGFYVFADYGWTQVSSAGVQYAMADLPSDPSANQRELDFYYTMHLTELRRLRFGVTLADGDEGDATRAYIQFTNFFGNHAHGANW